MVPKGYHNIVIKGLISDDGEVLSDGMASIEYYDAETDELVHTEPIEEIGVLAVLKLIEDEEKKVC